MVSGGCSGHGIALGVRVGQLIADAHRRRRSPAVVGRAAGRISRLIEADMGTGRLEAFSDGVIAIIITIMVLELKVPHGADLAALRAAAAGAPSYVLSFVYVGIYWNNHHHLLHAPTASTAAIMWANLHLLFWLSLIPFVTGWVGENHFAPLPTALYGVVLLMAGVAYFVLRATDRRARTGRTRCSPRRSASDRKGKLSLIALRRGDPARLRLAAARRALYVLVAAHVDRAGSPHRGARHPVIVGAARSTR